MNKIKPKALIIAGSLLVLLGVAGSVLSVAGFFGLSFSDFKEWDENQADTGFVPLALPLEFESEYQKGGLPSLPPLPTLTVSTLSASTVGEQSLSTPELEGTNEPQVTPVPVIPDRIIIPSIELDAPVVPMKTRKTRIGGEAFEQWEAPDKFAVGWYTGSAVLGRSGNTVLVGHHNVEGKVFENLHKVQPGEDIILMGGKMGYRYQVVNVMILPERNVDLQTRLENARWIMPSEDERVTLVTCWPAWSNTHRLIVVAQPTGEQISSPEELNLY